MTATIPALDFVSLLKDVPRGAWVAISSDHVRVISFGSDLRAVLEEAKNEGEEQPILTRVPETTGSLFL